MKDKEIENNIAKIQNKIPRKINVQFTCMLTLHLRDDDEYGDDRLMSLSESGISLKSGF